ncbi:glycosyltransferase, partial [Streptomyces clavuligerus]|uniref:glycosyltransferase n=1 Tax=Streptomyces clavuligerus TaxID=1901 RepID=UPI0018CFF968
MTAVQLSVVVPCRHDSEVIESRYAALLTALESTRRTFEICYVDDGSADRTRELLGALARADPRVRYTVFSRPFGREAALLAGLRMARGQTVILMDSGVRHPPELVPRMLALHSEGYDQVVAERDRTTHGPLRSALRDAGDRLVRHCMDVDVGDGAGDVRLLSRRAVDGVLALPESNRFSRGIFSWIGFATAGLTYREAAPGGSTDAADPRPPLGRRAVNEGIDGVLSFNSRPLRLAIHIGLGILFAALAYALWTALRVLLNGATVPGFATLLTAIVALGGIQLITLGVIGEYVGRIYHESKRRPHYLIQETDESRRPVPLPQHGPLPAAVPAGARAASRPADEGAGPGGTARQFLSFVLVGCVNTAVYFAVYVTLNRWTPYPVAHVLGYTVSVVGSFLLNSYVTCRTKPTWHAFMRYPISSLAGLVAAGCLLLLAVGRFGMDENAAALLAGVLATPLSFLLARWAITAGRRPPAATEPPEPTATTDTTGDSGPAGPAAPGGPPRRRISPAAEPHRGGEQPEGREGEE